MPTNITCCKCSALFPLTKGKCPKCGADILDPGRVKQIKEAVGKQRGKIEALVRSGYRAVEKALDEPRAGVWEPGTVLLDEYKVERVLGQGGMGAVYLVSSRSSGSRFAVKRVLSELVLDQACKRQFLRELQTWIDLPEHPNLTACRFFQTIGGEVVIFAEFVAGGSLLDWIRDGKLANVCSAVQVAVLCVRGLHAAHERGLVHQDVKPGNVLMTPYGVPKVTDFGLACARPAPEPVTALAEVGVTFRGMTPAYCSPEQAEGKKLTRHTDLWSWGVSVLEMCIGERVWGSGLAAPEVLEQAATQSSGWTSSSAQGLGTVPGPVAEVLRRCFLADPARRWATLAVAAAALESAGRTLPTGNRG